MLGGVYGIWLNFIYSILLDILWKPQSFTLSLCMQNAQISCVSLLVRPKQKRNKGILLVKFYLPSMVNENLFFVRLITRDK